MNHDRLLKITYTKSAIGYNWRQKDTIRSMGLKRLGDCVLQPDNAAVRGMVQAVSHLVTVVPVDDIRVIVEEPKGGKRGEG